MSRPVAYLLSGLPCSGKSTYARALAGTGVVRLSLDDAMAQRFGRPGKDYAGHLQPEREPDVLRQLDLQLVELLRAGVSVVFDHGLGRRDERNRYKRLVTGAGAEWVLVGQRAGHAAGVPFLAGHRAGMATHAGVQVNDQAEFFRRGRRKHGHACVGSVLSP